MATLTAIPNSYADMTNINMDATYGINRAYANADSTTFARMNIPAGLTGSIFLIFSPVTLSTLPDYIDISNVTIRFKARINGTARVLDPEAQLYSGDTPKGTAQGFSTTTATIFTFSIAGPWTRAELLDLKLKVSGTASVDGSVRRIDFFGADVTIEYELSKYYNVIEAVQLAVQIANDPAHGYNQKARYGPDYDCSSLVSYCLQQAGFNIDPHGTATINMAPKLSALGFTNVINEINRDTGEGLQYGDILLTVTKHHVEFSLGYLPDNQIVEAVHDEHGGKGGSNTQPGDQTGDEIRIRRFYRYQWEYCFRWTTGGGSGPLPVGGSFIIKLPTLRRGNKYAVIGGVQTLLSSRYNISVGKAGIDNEYGPATEKAVKTFQKDKGLEADGVVGKKTWTKLLEVDEWN